MKKQFAANVSPDVMETTNLVGINPIRACASTIIRMTDIGRG